VTVVDPGFVLPVHHKLIELAATHRLVATIEDGVRVGGVGSRLALELTDAGVTTPVRSFGLPPQFLEQGTRDGILREQGLSDQAIARVLVETITASQPVEPSERGLRQA
jgi:1-deoxy-D-xylulose-5-phosphate synthase